MAALGTAFVLWVRKLASLIYAKILSGKRNIQFVLYSTTDYNASATYETKSNKQEVLIEEQLDAWQAQHFEEFLNHKIEGIFSVVDFSRM